ncbi:hypothetical protein HDU67_001427 [Dinochytrium kinnereticum]|nr:hypothetical protein HDU67_001427 [Dinochytrium kinnereticum]
MATSLAGLLKDIGYVATSSSNALRAALNHGGFLQINSLSEDAIADVLTMMCLTHTNWPESDTLPEIGKVVFSGLDDSDVRPLQTWDIEIFITTILQLTKTLDWVRVLRKLDNPSFDVDSAKALNVVLMSSRIVLKDLHRFPIQVFFDDWKYPKGQFAFLKHAVQLTPELFDGLQTTRHVINESLIIPAAGKALFNAIINQPWNNLDLLDTFMRLSEKELYEDVKVFLELSFQHSPELILLGLAQLAVPWSPLHKELASNLVMMFLVGHPNSAAVLPLLWQLNHSLTLAGLVHLYSKDPSLLSRILDIAQEIKEVASACRQAYPRLANFPISQPESILSADVGEEVDAIFEKIYKGMITIPQIVDILKKFRDSTNKREVDMYNCFISVLFEESKNCLKDYPDKHLYATSVLFGALIQSVIVVTSTLMTALTFVLEALRQPIGSKLFKFGSQALLQFQSRLVEWPQYSTLLLQIPHLHQAHPEIIAFIRNFESQQQTNRLDPLGGDPSTAAMGAGQPRDVRNGEQAVFTALKLDTLLEAADKDSFEVPGETVQDKILFIINNVSFDNLELKILELKEILRETHFRWFSHYIVVKRSSIEPNFHELYISFLESLQQPALHRNILHETYSNIKILLNSEKTVTSSSERSLLKNLGTWLGGITLAKNRPIKHKNLAFKDLLIEGYDSDRLIVVIPFCCKVLEQCHNSKIFKPPNPWLMAIMKLLAELYHFADLRLNLKFEVEVLCKKIRLDIKDIAPSFILRNRQSKISRDQPKIVALNDENIATPPISIALQPPSLTLSSQSPEEAQVGYPQLASYLTFNPNLPIFNAQPSLKRIVYIAIDRAIREIISPVVERSVTIASIATRELVVKDFALEPSEDRMRKAAHLMVQNLAGSLASVSSREPLRVSMMSQLRSLLLQNGYTEQSIPEQVVYIIVADNLDLACSVMEKAAAEKATHEIDESLASAFINRRKHRERTNQPFYDVAIYAASRYPSSLPDPLRLKAGGLTPLQLRVYEDFSRIAKAAPDASERLSRLRPENSSATNAAYDDNAPQIQAIVEKFALYQSDLDKLITVAGDAAFASLPQHHDIRSMLRQILNFFAQTLSRDDWLLMISQKIVRHIYSAESQLSRECYSVLLERLLDMSKRAGREFASWFLYADDERKLNVDVTVAFLQTQLLTLPDLDAHVARMIECGRPGASDFASALLKRTVLDEPQGLSKEGLQNCVEILGKLSGRGSISSTAKEVFEAVTKKFNLPLGKETVKENDPSALRDKLGSLFLEWVRVYHNPSSNARTHVLYIFQLQQQGILGDDVSSLFFRICTELSVESYVKAKASPMFNTSPFQAVDAFAKLIVLLVRYNLNLMTNLMTKILSIVVLVLVHSHEQKRSTFNQRPFFRLFSSLLSELDVYDEQLQPLSFQILSAMSNTFHTLQPSFLPGFTFSWIQLISHRYFMPKLLLAENSKGWPFFQRLLVDLFKFLGPFLRETEMVETTRLAFPRNMRLPDPFTPNLKVDLLPEINQPPRVMSDYTSSLIPGNFKVDIDTYLKTRGPVSFLLDLRSRLLSPASVQSESGTKYNVPVINALVLYVGVQAITQAQSKPLQGSPPITHSAPMDIFQQLIVDLDTEGRYLFVSAIANQLRYPNSHTHYFSCVLLYLFAEANQEIIQEQITRVLIERLIVNRPHPYGLLITFIELIRNPRYSFWDHTNFIRCAPEIERLFSSERRFIDSNNPLIVTQQNGGLFISDDILVVFCNVCSKPLVHSGLISHIGPIDLDKQCGVVLETGQLCTRSITCKIHSVSAKRSVFGRTQQYDTLFQEYHLKSREAKGGTQKLMVRTQAAVPMANLDMTSEAEAMAVFDAIRGASPSPISLTSHFRLSSLIRKITSSTLSSLLREIRDRRVPPE